MAAFRKTLGRHQAFGRHLTVPVKDTLEMLVKIFNRARPKLMEDPPHLDALVGVSVAAIPGRHQ